MRPFQPITYSIIIGGSLLIASSAIAGGFAIREQSTTGLGKAFADSAAGTDLSSMFWNPAAVTVADGLNSVSSFSAIKADTRVQPTAGTSFGTTGTTIDEFAVLGASYYNYQINQKLYVGLSINSPLGLVTDADNKLWGGAAYNRRSEILTVNAAPTVGYKILPNLSIAAGLQVEYMKVRLASAVPVAALFANDIVIKGDDVAVGFTLGALYKSEDTGTSLGIGYRSSISHKLEGTLHGHPAIADGNIKADLDTPEMVTVSLRQDVASGLALMANFEWSNWSRLKELRVRNENGAADIVEDFSWNDSWLISLGAEMNVSPALTARAGLGFEKTPVPASTRSARLPDSDRVWLSFGGSYKWSEATTLDLGYSHIFFDDSKIALASLTKGVLNANVKNSADILSIGARIKW
ncbi:MAG: outer membrane protein transport protein [Hyphomicrobiaceae bacterium]|nr:outer membrane protein transport protein [Hyphomicrobiaceae bacterium]